MRRVAFRVDASLEIGTGHVMRCLVLADALRQQGVELLWLARALPESLELRLKQSGISLHLLPSDAAEAIGFTLDETRDAEACRPILQSGSPDWLVVDHYGISRCWEDSLRPYYRHLLVIDDLADRPHRADILLDQNDYRHSAERYSGLLSEGCRPLLGPAYALLRESFRQAAAQPKPAIRPHRLNLCFGGVDAAGMTGFAIEALAGALPSDWEVDVIIGGGNPHREALLRQCEAHLAFRPHVDPANLPEVMHRADLALGAGGSMTWERCLLGLPGIIITVADNQRQLAADAAAGGYAICLGDMRQVTAAQLRQSVLALMQDAPLRERMALLARQRVDGRGIERLLAAMTELCHTSAAR